MERLVVVTTCGNAELVAHNFAHFEVVEVFFGRLDRFYFEKRSCALVARLF